MGKKRSVVAKKRLTLLVWSMHQTTTFSLIVAISSWSGGLELFAKAWTASCRNKLLVVVIIMGAKQNSVGVATNLWTPHDHGISIYALFIYPPRRLLRCA